MYRTDERTDGMKRTTEMHATMATAAAAAIMTFHFGSPAFLTLSPHPTRRLQLPKGPPLESLWVKAEKLG